MNDSCVAASSGVLAGDSWVIGVALGVLAALANNLGVNLQKLAWTKKQLQKASGPVYRLIWVVGLLGVILASVFDFVALFFAPQSVIAPLGALTMVSNACVAPWMHGEVMHRIAIVATLVIVAGCVMSVATANHSNAICPPEALFQLYFAPLFLGYIAVLITIILGTMLFVRKAEAACLKFGIDDPAYLRYFKFHRISYALIAGLFGAQSVLFTRSFNQLIVSTTNGGQNLFTFGQTWGIIIGLVGSIVLQLYWLNHGLARFESLYNVPVFTTAFIIDVVLGGGFLYGEFSGFSNLQATLFPLGIFLCVVGVIVLTTGSASHHSEDDVDEYVLDEDSPRLSQVNEDEPAKNAVLPVDHAPVAKEPRGTGGLYNNHESSKSVFRVSKRISLVIDDLIDELSPRTSQHGIKLDSPRGGNTNGSSGNIQRPVSVRISSRNSLRGSTFSMLPHTALLIAGASEPKLRVRSVRNTHHGGSPRDPKVVNRRHSHSHHQPSALSSASPMGAPNSKKNFQRVQSLTVFSNGKTADASVQSTELVDSPAIRPSPPPDVLNPDAIQEGEVEEEDNV